MFKICYMKNGDLEHTYIFNGEENRSEDSVTYFSTKIFMDDSIEDIKKK